VLIVKLQMAIFKGRVCEAIAEWVFYGNVRFIIVAITNKQAFAMLRDIFLSRIS